MVVGIDYTYLLNSVPIFMKILLTPIIQIFKSIGQWRFRTKFLSFPIDMWIFRIGALTFIFLNKRFRMVNIGG